MPPPKTPERCDDEDCQGDHNGYVRHRNRHEIACPATRKAHRLYVAERRAAQAQQT